MVALNPRLDAQEAAQRLRARSADTQDPPKAERRSDFYERLRAIQSSEALRKAPSCAYRLAVTVAMLAHPDLFASVTTLAAHSGLSERVTKKALRALHDIGFLREKGGGWMKHRTCWTRLRAVRWDVLADTESRTGGEQTDTPRGEQMDTPRGEQTDTHKQQGNPFGKDGKQQAEAERESAEPNPRGRDARAEGSEGGDTPSGSDDGGRDTTTASMPPAVAALDLSADLAKRDRLKAVGIPLKTATLYARAFSTNAIETVCTKAEGKNGYVRDLPAFVVHLLKADYPAEYLAFEETKQAWKDARARQSRDKRLGRYSPPAQARS